MPERCTLTSYAYLHTSDTTTQPNGTKFYFWSTDRLSPIHSMTVRTFCDSHVDHAHVQTKLEITIDPIHTEVTDQFSAVTFLIGMLIPISFTRCSSSTGGSRGYIRWPSMATNAYICATCFVEEWKVSLVLRCKWLQLVILSGWSCKGTSALWNGTSDSSITIHSPKEM